MPSILIAPDKFKNTLAATEVADEIASVIDDEQSHNPLLRISRHMRRRLRSHRRTTDAFRLQAPHTLESNLLSTRGIHQRNALKRQTENHNRPRRLSNNRRRHRDAPGIRGTIHRRRRRTNPRPHMRRITVKNLLHRLLRNAAGRPCAPHPYSRRCRPTIDTLRPKRHRPILPILRPPERGSGFRHRHPRQRPVKLYRRR